MARLKTGILGSFNGKIGSIYGKTRNSVKTIISKVRTVNNYEPTQSQQEHINQIRSIANILNVLYYPIVKNRLQNFTDSLSDWANFTKLNYHNIVNGLLPWPNDLILTIGELAPAPIIDDGFEDGTTFYIVFNPDIPDDGLSSENDISNLVVYSHEQNKWYYYLNSGLRNWEYVDFPLEYAGQQFDDLSIYLFFTKQDSNIVSNSTYYNR